MSEKELSFFIMKLCGFTLICSSLALIVIQGELFIGFCLCCIGGYFLLLGQQKVKRSNAVYFSLMSLLAFSLMFQKEINAALFVTITIVIISFYFVHYHCIDD